MGLGDLIQFNQWEITSPDSTNAFRLAGQYRPEGFRIEKPPVVSSATTAGATGPSLQWVSGGAEVFRFRSRFRATHNLDNIGDKIDFLRSLRARDENLGRAPRVTFAWGQHEITGFVTRCPLEIVGYWATGFPKQVVFDMEITEAPDAAGDPTSGETQFIRLAAGDTFEGLGQRYLGNPLRGELIRQLNPAQSVRPEAAGDVVRVFEREHPAMRATVQTGSVPFTEQTRTPGDWQSIVEELGATRGVDQRGLPYALLPEVLAGLVP